MNKQELRNAIQNCDIEIASMVSAQVEEIRSGKIKAEDAKAKVEELRAKKADLEKQLAAMEAPKDEETRSALPTNEDFLKAAQERRSITIGSNGNINQVKKLVAAVGEVDGILAKAEYFYGPNATTAIPVLDPIMTADFASEGATSIGSDSQAVFGTTEIQPKALVSVLPVSAEALAMGTVDLASELPAIFQKAFAKKMHDKMVTGNDTGKGFKGIFVDVPAGNVTSLAASQTSIKIADLAALALSVSDADEPYEIVMNSATYAKILADSTSGEDVELYKEGLIRNKEIEGVKVTLDRHAPTATTAGSVLAVAAPISRYGIGIGGEITIDPIKKPGDTNTYFQAVMFCGGKPFSVNDLKAIAVHA